MSSSSSSSSAASSSSSSSLLESAKRLAAHRAVDDYVRDHMKLGVGSGSTVVYAIERLAERVKAEALQVVCVPTSFQSQVLLTSHGLRFSSLNEQPELDVAIDGADEVDEALNLIKGGGGCQTLEKLVAAAARQLVIVADYTKDSSRLGEKWRKGVPLEVLPLAYVTVTKRLEAMGGKPALRMGNAATKMGPVITDNGNFLLDVDFGVIQDPAALNVQLTMIPGVVEAGLFPQMAVRAYFGQADGTVKIRDRPTAY